MAGKNRALILDDLFPERRELLLKLVDRIKGFSFEKTSGYDVVENVLLVQGGYGTGKTFFAKKLNDRLLDEGVDSVYFSAWEKDYVNQPFVVISETILKEIFKNNPNFAFYINQTYFVNILSSILTYQLKLKMGWM